MATPVLAADLLLGLSNPKAIERAIADVVAGAAADGFSSGMKGEIGKNQRRLQASMSQAAIAALRLQNKKEAENLREQYKKRTDQIKALYAQMEDQEEKIRQSKARGESDLARQAFMEEQARLRALIREEQEAIEDNIDRLNAAQKDRLELLDEGMKRSAQNFGKHLEGYAESFESMIGKALSADNLDLGALAKDLGKAFAEQAPTMMSQGAAMAARGEAAGGAMGGIGAMLGRSAMALGAVAGTLAGVAAAVGAVVALFSAAYMQTKEFNKAILEGASAVDMLGTDAMGSARDLSDALGELRRGAMNVAQDFRMGTEEILAFSKAMNDANMTFKEQVQLFGSTEKAMRQALVATQAFGVGGSEVAEMINNMADNFAYGQHEIAQGFMDIFGAAQMSGMGVKNFFTAVSEATSGMALYNFRLEDTLEMMLGLEKILGQDMMKQVMGAVPGKFKEMGYQERLGFRMKMGGGVFRDIAGIETRKAESEFNAKFADLPPELKAALAARAPGAISGDGVSAKALAKLSGAQMGELQNVMRDAGFNELASQLGNMRRVGKGGGALMGEAGAETALAMDLSGAIGYLGDVLISDMSEIQKMAFEQNQGISGTMLKVYEDIQSSVAGRLKAQGKSASASDVARAIAEGGMLTPEEQKELAKVQMDASKSMDQIARDQLAETSSILLEIRNKITPLLEGLYDLMARVNGGVSVRDARLQMESVGKMTFDAAGAQDMGAGMGLMGPALDEFVASMQADFEKVKGRRLAFAEASYQGALGGKSRDDVFKEMTAGLSAEQKASMGLTRTKQGRLNTKTGEVSEIVEAVTVDQLTSEQLDKVLTAISSEEVTAGQKDAKKQVQATEEVRDEVKELVTLSKSADIERLTGFAATQQNYGKIRLKIMEDDVTPEEAAAFNRAYGLEGDAAMRPTVQDFIYRGDGVGGSITPINKADEFYGAKPNGPIDKALRGGGRSVVINNLTIHESGDPKKTLAMVKQAITAASGG